MKLILKEDIQNLGFKDDVVDVKNGYGRNYLIPKGKAVIATTSAVKILQENLRQRAFKEKSIVDQASKKAEKIKALKIKLSSKVGSEDKLFGSVTNSDLADAIGKKIPDIEKKHITLPGRTIKRLGKYVAKIRIHRDVSFEFPFEVVPEEKSKK
ncbi:MAG: 50S ribosomal protein L9 [Bacteroidota bacterium]|mgnify:FL=1|jgi:large subunit ribosomal protein L9|nr:50S ribosomal protein L9 [Bacteroidota bacterium]